MCVVFVRGASGSGAVFANRLFVNTFVRVRSATPARLVYVDRWVLVLLLLEGGVHRSICAMVLGIFFGA